MWGCWEHRDEGAQKQFTATGSEVTPVPGVAIDAKRRGEVAKVPGGVGCGGARTWRATMSGGRTSSWGTR